MPIIMVKLAEGRTEEQKQNLVDAITTAVEQTLNVKREWISIILDEYSHDCWATGGTLHSIKFGKDWDGSDK